MPTNVLLISLDTLRADVAYSGAFPTMNRLRGAGTTFLRTVSSAPLTPISHSTVLTGLEPPAHGVRHLLREQLNPDVPTLAARFAAEGYRTGAVVSCPGLNRWYGLSRGFDHYDDEIPLLPDGRDPLKLADVKIRGTALKRAPLVVERALSWLRESAREPFFLFVHFFDSHWPYEPPEDFGIPVRNPYEGEVAYMDHYLGTMLDGMSELGYRLDDLLTVCFSDHGEDLAGWYANDHAGELGHPEEDGHGCLLYDCTLMVPLWIVSPGRVASGATVDSQVRLVDVASTIGELAGLPAVASDGASLRPLLDGETGDHRTARSETFFPEERAMAEPGWDHLRPLKSVRIGDRYKVIWQVGGESVEVYDLHADPDERSSTGFAPGLPASLLRA
jgi:arylsulfatase